MAHIGQRLVLLQVCRAKQIVEVGRIATTIRFKFEVVA